MADGGFRFAGTGQFFYQPQNQPNHHQRHLRNGSPVNNPRIGFQHNDTPSPNRSPGTSSPAFNMFTHGHQQNQHSLLNGSSQPPHHRFQMQMGMSKHYQHQGNQHQAGHHQNQHPEHTVNGHTYGSHQHNASTGTLSSNTPHFTPSHLQSNTPLGGQAGMHKPASEHWQEQIRLAQTSREATQPHHYARNSPGVNKQLVASLQSGGARKEDDKEDGDALSGEKKEDKQIWQALDFGGQGLKSISSFLFRYPFLEKLYLNHNKLTWMTPEIRQLKFLTFLDLSQNNLEHLPVEMGMLVHLKTLYLFDNNLETLPPEMGFLWRLEMLGIEGNPLSEDIKSIMAEAGTGELVRWLREQIPVPDAPRPREMVILDETPMSAAAEDRVSMLDWNILCDNYTTTSQYPYAPSTTLDWEYRKRNILDEIRTRGADIVCLQECDHETFNEYFRPTLAHDDYKGFLFQKSRSQTMSEKEIKIVDGCAIFYKNSKYILLDKQLIEFGRTAINRPDMKGEHDVFNRVMTRDDIAAVAFLENRATGSRLIVANTHIFWNPAFNDVKCVQVAILMETLAQLAEGYAARGPCKDKELFRYANGETNGDVPKEPGPSMSYASGPDIPMLIGGDFNSVPGTGVYDLIVHGSLPNTHQDMAGMNYGNLTREGMHHPFSLRSSYANMGELQFTNYVPHYRGVLDYIWYSTNTLQNTALLGDIDMDFVRRVPGFPYYHFPSDHLPLYAEYVVREKREKKIVDADFGPSRDRRH